jgi:hypothetical protein
MRVRLTKLFVVLTLSVAAVWGYQVILEAEDSLCTYYEQLCFDNGCCRVPPCEDICHLEGGDHCDCGPAS